MTTPNDPDPDREDRFCWRVTDLVYAKIPDGVDPEIAKTLTVDESLLADVIDLGSSNATSS